MRLSNKSRECRCSCGSKKVGCDMIDLLKAESSSKLAIVHSQSFSLWQYTQSCCPFWWSTCTWLWIVLSMLIVEGCTVNVGYVSVLRSGKDATEKGPSTIYRLCSADLCRSGKARFTCRSRVTDRLCRSLLKEEVVGESKMASFGVPRLLRLLSERLFLNESSYSFYFI
jgi:hypothetical protein